MSDVSERFMAYCREPEGLRCTEWCDDPANDETDKAHDIRHAFEAGAGSSRLGAPKTWSEAMQCICKDKPNRYCRQWEYHWEYRDTPGAFRTADFEEVP